MKSLLTLALGAAALGLSACGGQGDDALGDNVAEAAEAKAENLETMAENATTEAQSDMLEQKAEQVEQIGTATEEAIDEADVQVNQ